jgi:protocatechuate 4,5-dioxygenase, beta chain
VKVAQLVQLIGVQHNPVLHRRFQQPELAGPALAARQRYEDLRQQLAAARPDVLLVVANDHLNQWFMDNMPPFLLGKAPRAEGPFPHEMRELGLPAYRAPGDAATARALVEASYEHGIDLAWSDEYLLDHAFVVPLTYLRPEADLPIIPFFSNVMAPPLPPARRFHAVGGALRAAIAALPAALRVAVVASGHLSVEIGGPRVMREAPDAAFDTRVVDLIGRGDVDGLLTMATPERMQQAGNLTAAFLNFVLLVGLAGGQPPTEADAVPLDTSTTPFFSWRLHDGAAR